MAHNKPSNYGNAKGYRAQAKRGKPESSIRTDTGNRRKTSRESMGTEGLRGASRKGY